MIVDVVGISYQLTFNGDTMTCEKPRKETKHDHCCFELGYIPPQCQHKEEVKEFLRKDVEISRIGIDEPIIVEFEYKGYFVRIKENKVWIDSDRGNFTNAYCGRSFSWKIWNATTGQLMTSCGNHGYRTPIETEIIQAKRAIHNRNFSEVREVVEDYSFEDIGKYQTREWFERLQTDMFKWMEDGAWYEAEQREKAIDKEKIKTGRFRNKCCRTCDHFFEVNDEDEGEYLYCRRIRREISEEESKEDASTHTCWELNEKYEKEIENWEYWHGEL